MLSFLYMLVKPRSNKNNGCLEMIVTHQKAKIAENHDSPMQVNCGTPGDDRTSINFNLLIIRIVNIHENRKRSYTQLF